MASLPPDSPIRVVAACIFKNEAHNLPALFASAKGLIDAWVIVDTGSTDGTLDAALEQGRLHGVPVHTAVDLWDDDFARSRNVSLDLVDAACPEAEWVMVLDGDDRFDGPLEARAQLDTLMAGNLPDGLDEPPAFLGIRVDSPTHTGLMETLVQVRTFRRSEGIRYVYPVHGKPDLDRWEPDEGDEPAHAWKLEDCRVLHMGYDDPDHHEENLDRTLRILRTKMDPDDLHRMAYEARALAALGCWEEAHEITSRALDLGESHTTGVILSLHAQAALQGGDAVEALESLASALYLDDAALDVWYAALGAAFYGFVRATAAALDEDSGGKGLSANLPNVPTVIRHAVQAGFLTVPEPGLRKLTRQIHARTRVPWREPTPIEPDDPFLLHVPPELRARKTGMRVLIVQDREIAGQGGLIMEALNRYTVHAARMITYEDDYLGFSHKDLVLADEGGSGAIHEASVLADAADFFHTIRRPRLNDYLGWGRRMQHDNALVQYMGSDVRANPTELTGWHGRTGILGLSAWDWTMLEHAWMPYHVPLMLDVDAMGEGKVYRGLDSGPFRVCHPATQRSFKKTELFLRAVDDANVRLTEIGTAHGIEAVLIEGMSNADCLTLKRSCHATFDQLSVGIHGLSAVESMTMGHAVLGGISAWARSFAPDVPIVRVTEGTLADQLVALAQYPEAVEGYGARGREYARKMHHPRVVAARLADLYEHVRHGNRPLRADEDYLL